MAKSKWILLAEDNEIDADLALRSLGMSEPRAAGLDNDVLLVSDGLQALDCLYRRGEYAGRDESNPAVVLLDIKMPKVGGLEVLRQIKSDPKLKSIPVVMFTSSREEVDLASSYQYGANAYLVKPVGFTEFRAVLDLVRRFWMTMNELPGPGDRPSARSPGSPPLATAA
jgi:two-component system, response regulator